MEEDADIPKLIRAASKRFSQKTSTDDFGAPKPVSAIKLPAPKGGFCLSLQSIKKFVPIQLEFEQIRGSNSIGYYDAKLSVATLDDA
jgi:hypothetical protein